MTNVSLANGRRRRRHSRLTTPGGVLVAGGPMKRRIANVVLVSAGTDHLFRGRV
jgi:hypothetical protein